MGITSAHSRWGESRVTFPARSHFPQGRWTTILADTPASEQKLAGTVSLCVPPRWQAGTTTVKRPGQCPGYPLPDPPQREDPGADLSPQLRHPQPQLDPRNRVFTKIPASSRPGAWRFLCTNTGPRPPRRSQRFAWPGRPARPPDLAWRVSVRKSRSLHKVTIHVWPGGR